MFQIKIKEPERLLEKGLCATIQKGMHPQFLTS
jgi:hypothetical protein